MSNVVALPLGASAPVMGWITSTRYVVQHKGLPTAVEWIKKNVPEPFQKHLMEHSVRYARFLQDEKETH